MPKFKKKPIEIEARKFRTNNEADDVNMNSLCRWINDNGGEARHDGTNIYIKTLASTVRVDCFDWIIRDVKGEFYPCKPDVFEASYDVVKRKIEGLSLEFLFGATHLTVKNEDSRVYMELQEDDVDTLIEQLTDIKDQMVDFKSS